MALLVDERTYRSNKRVHKRKKVLGKEVPYQIYVLCVELCCVIGLLGLLHQKSRAAHFLWSHGRDGSRSWLPTPSGTMWLVSGPGPHSQ
jgi:hypothetical protein